MCPLVIKCDLEYWGLDELLLEPCCALKYYPEVAVCVAEIQVILCQKHSFLHQLIQNITTDFH